MIWAIAGAVGAVCCLIVWGVAHAIREDRKQWRIMRIGSDGSCFQLQRKSYLPFGGTWWAAVRNCNSAAACINAMHQMIREEAVEVRTVFDADGRPIQ